MTRRTVYTIYTTKDFIEVEKMSYNKSVLRVSWISTVIFIIKIIKTTTKLLVCVVSLKLSRVK